MIVEDKLPLAEPIRKVAAEFKVDIRREENQKLFGERRKIKLNPQTKLYFNHPAEMKPEGQDLYNLDSIASYCIQLKELSDKRGMNMMKYESVLKNLRISVSRNETPPIYILMEHDTLKDIIIFLEKYFDSCSNIRIEVLWILINVLANIDGNGLEVIKGYELPEKFMNFFKQPYLMNELAENLIWCISNYIQADPSSLDFFLQNGLIEGLGKLGSENYSSESDISLVSTIVWLLYTVFLMTDIQPYCNKYLHLIRKIMKVDLFETDLIAILLVLRTISRDKDNIQSMMNLGFDAPLLKELKSYNPPVAQMAARIIANCLSVDEEVDIVFVKAGILRDFEELANKQKLKEFPKLREKVAFMIGNLLCSSTSICNMVCNSPIMEWCLAQLAEEIDSKIQSTLIDIFKTFYLRGDSDLLFSFTKNHPAIIEVILKFTGTNLSQEANIKSLIIVNKILGLGENYKTDQFLDYFLESGSAQKLEILQHHQDITVYNFVALILDKYFAEN